MADVRPTGRKDPANHLIKELPLGTIISPNWDKEWIEKVAEVEKELGYAICGARAPRKGTVQRPCRQRAGHNTDHPGEGRCKIHGGASPVRTGRWSLLRHHDVATKVRDFFDSSELMNIRSNVATSWAVLDELLEDENPITPDRAMEVVQSMAKISTMIKQHHDITEGQRIKIEVPQFMEWAEHLYELAVKYIQNAGGDVSGFLAEAQSYYTGAVAVVTGDSPPALGDGGPDEDEIVLRPGEPEPGSTEGPDGSDLLR